MSKAIARVHVDDYEPEIYRGDEALELALVFANQMREDFPGAIVGVSYNPEAAKGKYNRLMDRLGIPRKDGNDV